MAARVVLDAMQPMLMTIVRDVIAADASAEIVAEGIPAAELDAVVERLRPDVVVLGAPGAALAGSDQALRLLQNGRSPLKVIALADRNRSATLYELRPHITVIEPLSPEALRAAITGATLPGAVRPA